RFVDMARVTPADFDFVANHALLLAVLAVQTGQHFLGNGHFRRQLESGSLAAEQELRDLARLAHFQDRFESLPGESPQETRDLEEGAFPRAVRPSQNVETVERLRNISQAAIMNCFNS